MPEIIVKLGDSIVHKHFLYKDEISIGRSPENEIAIENLAVSRKHASLRKSNGNYVIEDHGSANGTYVNGVRITKTEILDKDVITIGKHKLHFYNQEEPAVAAAAPIDFAEKTMLVERAPILIPKLKITHGKQKDEIFELNKVETRVGRAQDNDICLNDWFVSKHHAVIVRKGTNYIVRDLASWRHTLVNGLIIQEQVLKAGDEIQFGPKITSRYDFNDSNELEEGSGRMPVEMAGESESPKAFGPNGRERISKPSPLNWIDENQPKASASAPGVLEEEEEIRSDSAVEESPAPEISKEQPEAPIGTAVWSMEAVEERVRAASVINEDIGFYQSDPDAEEGVEPKFTFSGGDDEPSSSEDPSTRRAFATVENDWQSNEAPAGDAEINFASAESEFSSHETIEPSTPEEHDTAAQAEPSGACAVEPAPSEPAPTASQPAEDEAHKVADAISSVAGELSGADPKEVAMWMRALANPSKAIRKQAQRKLKVLTGRDYDIE